MTVVLLAHRRIDLPNDRVSACGFDLPHEMTCWLSHRPPHGATPAAINNGLQLAGAEIAAAVTAQPADLLVVGGGPTGLGKPTSRPFSSTHSPTQTLEVFGHAVGKHLEVWNEVGVADDVEVQLAGVGQCPDLDGDVALDDADLEQFEDLGAGEVQGLLGAGEVAHEQVDPPLAVHGVNHPARRETRRGLVGRETFPFCCLAGYLLQPPGGVFLVHGHRDEQDADEIPCR
jgi:hypothetical protein